MCRRPVIEPGPGEISLVVDIAGVCGTDLQILRGQRDDPASVLGHEGRARVSQVGEGVGEQLAPGTPVLVNPTHPTSPGVLLGHTFDGLFQERVVIPRAAVSGGLVLPLAEHERPKSPVGVLTEPLAVAYQAMELLRRHELDRLVVVGDGTIGHLVARVASSVADPPFIDHLHHSPAGLAWSRAREPGADVRRAATPGDITGAVRGRQPDSVGVVLATPRDATLAALGHALNGAGPGHRVVIDIIGGLPAGSSTPQLPGLDLTAARAANTAGFPAVPAVVRQRTTMGAEAVVMGHRGVPERLLRLASSELVRGPHRFDDLVTHDIRIDDAVPVLRQLACSRDRTIDSRRLIKLAIRMGTGDST